MDETGERVSVQENKDATEKRQQRLTCEMVEALNKDDNEERFMQAAKNMFASFGIQASQDEKTREIDNQKLRLAYKAYHLGVGRADIEIHGQKLSTGGYEYANVYVRKLQVGRFGVGYEVCPGACSLERHISLDGNYGRDPGDFYERFESAIGVDTLTYISKKENEGRLQKSERVDRDMNFFVVLENGAPVRLPVRKWSIGLMDKLYERKDLSDRIEPNIK